MSPTGLLQLLLVSIIGIYFLIILIKKWDAFPFLLLPLVWYLPEQTSPGRLLENYIFVRWFTVIMIPFLMVIAILKRRFFKTIRYISGFYLLIAIFIIISFISAFLNNKSLFDVLSYLSIYLRYPIFFLVLTTLDLTENVMRKFLILFSILLAIQFPEVFIRYSILGIKGDEVSWSLGSWGTANLGIYMIYGGCLIIAHALHKNITLWHIAGILIFFIIAIFGEIKTIMVWFIIVILVTVVFHPFQTKIKKYIIIFVIIILIFPFGQTIYQYWNKVHGIQLANIFQSIYLTLQGNVGTEDKYSLYRLGILLRIVEGIRQNTTTFLFGFGPGSSFIGNFSGIPGLIIQYLGSGKDTPNQYASILLDVGLTGLINYFLILVFLIKIWRKSLNVSDDNQNMKLWAIIRTAFVGMIFYYLIVGPLYYPVWRFDASSYILYFFAAILYQRVKNGEKKSKH
uniref:O-antigen ligase domain-containing protein n=1 Tax=candidate division WOR-3 bacterium TaxID=2052148 RepID=A0A7V1EJ03_UNCW3